MQAKFTNFFRIIMLFIAGMSVTSPSWAQGSCSAPRSSQTEVTYLTESRALLENLLTEKSAYQWRIREQYSSAWSTSNISATSSFTANGLKPGKTYEYQARVRCGSTWSNWSSSSVFEFFSCIRPVSADIQVFLMSKNSVKLMSTIEGKEAYDWRYRQSGTPDWIDLPADTAFLTVIKEVTPGVDYEFQHRLKCNDVWSNWSNKGYFRTETTTCSIPWIEYVGVKHISDTSVKLSAPAFSLPVEYEWSIRKKGSSTWATAYSGTRLFFTFVNLMQGTAYEYRLRIKCHDGYWSDWSETAGFTTGGTAPITECDAPQAIDFEAIVLGPNSVQFESDITDVSLYDWQWRKKGSTVWTDTDGLNSDKLALDVLMAGSTYEFRHRVQCGSLWSDWSVIEEFTLPNIPVCDDITIAQTNVTTESANSVKITIGVSGLQTYAWRYRKLGETDWTQLSGSTNMVVLENLMPGSMYQYQVAGECTNGATSGWSEIGVFSLPQATVCAPIQIDEYFILLVNSTEVRIKIEFIEREFYQVRYREIGTQNFITLDPTDQEITPLTGLTAGTSYEFQVRGYCNDTWSSWSEINSFTTSGSSCTTPTILQTSTVVSSPTTAEISINISGQTAYDLQFRLQGTTTWTDLDASVGNTFYLFALNPGSTYQYRVRVNCGSAWSEWSTNGTFSTPAQINCPSPLLSEISAQVINETSATLQTTLTGKTAYQWRFRKLGEAGWLTSPGIEDTSVPLAGLVAGTTYEYQLRVDCDGTWSNWSASEQFTTGTAATCEEVWISEIYVTVLSSTSARVVIDADGRDYYQVRYRVKGSSTWYNSAQEADNSIDLTNLTAGADYEYQARTYCNGVWSVWSQTGEFSTPAAATCPTPTIAQTAVLPLSPTSVQITINITDQQAYDWRYRPVGTTNWINLNASASNQVTINGLTPGTSYEYQVATRCNNVWSSWSDSGFYTTAELVACDAPETYQFSAQETSATSFRLTTTITDKTALQWQIRKSGSSNWTTSDVTSSTIADVTGLQVGTTYEFRLRVRCGDTWSAYSEIESITLSTCEEVWLDEIYVVVLSATQARVTIDAPGRDYYQVRYRVAGTTSWTTTSQSEDHIAYLNNLSSNTTYEYQARSFCNGTWSVWSQTGTFATPELPCATPLISQTSVLPLSPSSVRIDINISGRTGYDWRYRAVGSSSWINLTATSASSITLNNLTPGTSYEYQVTVRCGSVWSSWSDSGFYTTAELVTCDAPETSQFSAQETSATSFKLTTTITDKTALQWQIRKSGSSNWTTSDVTSSTTANVTGLQVGATYEFRLRVWCGDVWSEFSQIETITLSNCEEVWLDEIYVVVLSATQVRVTIDAPGRDYYQVRYRVAGTTSWTTTSQSEDHIAYLNNLSPNTTYEYQARSFCNSTWSVWSQTGTFATPELPCETPLISQTSVLPLSPSSVQIDINISGRTGYDWRYRQVGASSWINVSSSTSNSVVLTNLTPGTSYEYQVNVRCGSSWSSWSGSGVYTTAELITCDAPENYQISAQAIDGTTIQLSTTLTNQVSYQWQYRVQGSSSWVTATASTNSSLTVSGLLAGTTYQYRLRVMCDDVWSDFSVVETLTTPDCGEVWISETYVEVFSSTTARITIDVDNREQYDWQYRVQGTSSWISVNSSTNNEVMLTALQPDTKYEYQVRVKCNGVWSVWSQNGTFMTPGIPCETPLMSQTSVLPLSPTSVQIDINLSGKTLYDWQYRVQGTSSWTEVSASTGNSTVLTGLTPATAYQYRVRVQCDGTWSDWSTIGTYTTAELIICDAPLSNQINAQAVNGSSILLTTTLNNQISYQWQYRVQGTSAWTTASASTNSSLMLSGLPAGTTYEYRLRVMCDDVWSSFSVTETVTVLDCDEVWISETYVEIFDGTSARITIDIDNRIEYDWRYRKVGVSNWTEVNSSATQQLSLTDLMPGATYEYQVRVKCNGVWSVWSQTGTFNTPSDAYCEEIWLAEIFPQKIAPTSFRILIEGVDKDLYDWRYRPKGTSTWINVTERADNFVDLTNLLENTTYELQVRGYCDDAWSIWSETDEFMTMALPVCEAFTMSEISATVLSATMVRFAVTSMEKDYVNWRYREQGTTQWQDLGNTSELTIDVAELDPGTTYEFQVRGYCNELWSDWSVTKTFTTPIPEDFCEEIWLAEALVQKISATAVRMYIEGVDKDLYDWRYRREGSSTWIQVSERAENYADLSGLITNATYEFQMRGFCNNTWSIWSETGTFMTMPPATCEAIDISNTSVNVLSSSSVSITISDTGKDFYNLRYRKQGTTSWTDLDNQTNNVFMLTGLAQGMDYEYQVRVFCNGIWSSWSGTGNFSIPSQSVCMTPSITSTNIFVLSNTSVRIFINIDNKTAYDWRYRVKGTTNWTEMNARTENYIEIDGLSSGTMYEYQIRVLCESVWSAWSGTASFTTGEDVVCESPTLAHIRAEVLSPTSAQLITTINDANRYQWRYRLSTDATWTTLFATAEQTAQLSDLTQGATYVFQLRVECSDFYSEWSTGENFTLPVATTCDAPELTDVAIIPMTTTSVKLRIDINSDRYDWRYRQQGSTAWTEVPSSVSNEYLITELTPGTTYEFQVRVRCGDTWSAYSVVGSFATDADSCPQPWIAEVVVDLISGTSVSITIDFTDKTSYDWRYREVGTTAWIDLAEENDPTKVLTGLSEGVTYEYQVRVQCGTEWSEWSDIGDFTTPDGACPRPASSKVTILSVTEDAATFFIDVDDVNAYQVHYRRQGFTSWYISDISFGNTITIENLYETTTYEFAVRVRCGSSWSEWSLQDTFTTAEVCYPPTESDVRVEIVSTNSARLISLMGDKSRYDWRIREVGASSWIEYLSTENASLLVTALQAGTTYEVQHRYRCINTWSEWADAGNFTTPLSAVCEPININDDVTVDLITVNSARINVNSAGREQYDIRYRKAGTSSWTDLAATTNSSTVLNGLEDNTTYQFEIRTFCSGVWSDWAGIGTFTTLVAENCFAPLTTDFSVQIIDDQSVRFVSAITDVTRYDWRYRRTDASTWNEPVSQSANTLTVNNLIAGVTYEFQHRTTCAQSWTDWSDSETFIIPAAQVCDVPTIAEVVVDEMSNDEVRITINTPNRTHFNWRYRLAGTATWIEVGESVLRTVLLSNLNLEATYEYQVRTNCGDIWSEWSSTRSFTLPQVTPSCDQPTTSDFGHQLTGDVSVAFTSQLTDADRYDWRYRQVGSSTWINPSSQTVNSLSVGSLLAGVTYEYQHRIMCGTEWSEWSVSRNFSTVASAVCDTPELSNTYVHINSDTSVDFYSHTTGKSQYDWRYRPQGSSSWIDLNATANLILTVNGLQAGTTYEYQHRLKCDQVWSAWSATGTFTTSTVIYQPNLTCENGAFSLVNNVLQIEDVQIINDGNATAGASTVSYYLSWNHTITEFDIRIGSDQVGSIAAGQTALSGLTVDLNQLGLTPGNYYLGYMIDINDEVNESNEADNICFWLDQHVEITEETQEPECSIPTGITVDATDYSRFTVNWTSDETVESYQVRYRLQGGEWIVLDDWANPRHTSFNKQPCSTYEWQVRSFCGNDTYSDWSSIVQIQTEGCDDTYCYSYGKALHEYIWEIEFADLFNESGLNYGYTNFTNMAANVTAGQTYNLTLTPGSTDSSTDQVYWVVWIDWNQDGDFYDSDEKIIQHSGFDNQTVQKGITVPSGALGGSTRMRISMGVGAYPNPCETGTYIEVEDYTINVTQQTGQANLTCVKGGEVSVYGDIISISNNKITNDGTAPTTGFEVGFYLDADADFKNNSIKLTSIYLQGLNPGEVATNGIDIDLSQYNIPPGTYYVGYMIDDTNVVDESDEWDNTCYWSGTQITIQQTSQTAGCGCTNSYASSICESFENYNVGYLGPQSQCWTTWNGWEASAEDGLVTSDMAYTGQRALEVIPGNQDVVLKLGNRSSGQYLLKWYMKIPSGKYGYYNLQESETPGVDWNLEVFMGTRGNGVGYVKTTGHEFYYPLDQWFLVEHLVDMNNNLLIYKVNGQTIMSMPYTGNLGAVDFYALDNYTHYYIDDLRLTPVDIIYTNSTQEQPLAERKRSLRHSPVLDAETVETVLPELSPILTETNESAGAAALSMQAYPNPTSSVVNVLTNIELTQSADLELLNSMGQRIAYRKLDAGSLLNEQFNLQGEAAGMYILKLRTGQELITKRVLYAPQ